MKKKSLFTSLQFNSQEINYNDYIEGLKEASRKRKTIISKMAAKKNGKLQVLPENDANKVTMFLMLVFHSSALHLSLSRLNKEFKCKL